ncbi:MAG: BadF/BadG/BcrA/BcrD ATPase family protein [Pseudomonadota bacterium]
MIESGRIPHIGIDGGGTGCRIACVTPDGRVQVEGGPANVSTDLAGATARIAEALSRLAAQIDVPLEEVLTFPAHAGLAGVMDGASAAEMAARLSMPDLTVTDDRPTSLAGALGALDGSVAAIGTGSFIGHQRGSQARFAGGWGFALGDEASGAWLGRAALAATLRSVDGLEAEGDLTRKLLADFGGAASIVRFSTGAEPAGFAEIAPAVVASAKAGDSLGDALMKAGAAYIDKALQAVDRQDDKPLCLIGGLGAQYAPYLSAALQDAVVPPLGDALDGALFLAAAAAGAAL